MKNMIISLLLLAKVTTGVLFAQIDFDNYQSLISKGSIPADFTKFTLSKIEENKGTNTELSKKSEKEFLETIHFNVDMILQSGAVLYGDPITVYINDVAKNLLKHKPELMDKLRFYTIKSNATNAFCTDQGIIFVSTGLISQIVNEAQLAYVLAHEISHYEKKHIVQKYDYTSKSSNRFDISLLSKYSKDHELEADLLGIELYHKAGYAKEELILTFDVLNYSHLPFDEVEFSKTYFDTDKSYLPKEFFPETSYPIKNREEDDDSHSTHPNILSRKTNAETKIAEIKSWGTEVNKLGTERFNEVQNIARFETIRYDVIDYNGLEALYGIYLLEPKFSGSTYLTMMKAKAWFGILQLAAHDMRRSLTPGKNSFEGEIGSLYHVFYNLDSKAVVALSARSIYDIYRKKGEEKGMRALWKATVRQLAGTDNFNLNDFYDITYQQAIDTVKQGSDTLVNTAENPSSASSTTKYDKIKDKAKTGGKVTNSGQFDYKTFWKYILSDMIIDQDFLSAYNEEKATFTKEKEEQDRYNSMSKSQRKKYRKRKEKEFKGLGNNELIVMEPIVRYYTKNKVKRIKSEKISSEINEVVDEQAKATGIHANILSRYNLSSIGTPGYNEKAVLYSYLSQFVISEEILPFPVDYNLINDIRENYGTPYVVFTEVEHIYRPNSLFFPIYTTIYMPPLGLGLLTAAFLKGHYSSFSYLVIDIDRNDVAAVEIRQYKNPVNKPILASYYYNMFKTFNPKKK